ncbi:hypothetical protein BE08_10725 [Sorangium cellulosum]|uniref:Uncharacterized protein n=1 Tax=Sorangium cellulosum TaxID=56 RepID=A0A150PR24_SORCE|nr:hypothetical protein BE08_10725 [Sorangium cellulosum]
MYDRPRASRSSGPPTVVDPVCPMRLLGDAVAEPVVPWSPGSSMGSPTDACSISMGLAVA